MGHFVVQFVSNLCGVFAWWCCCWSAFNRCLHRPISIKKQYANQNNRSIHMKINRRKCACVRNEGISRIDANEIEFISSRARHNKHTHTRRFCWNRCCCCCYKKKFTSFKCYLCFFFFVKFYYFILNHGGFILVAVVFMCQYSHLINNHATRAKKNKEYIFV